MQGVKGRSYTDNAVVRTLDNGFTVTLERLPYLHSATAGIWIKTGSAHELKEQCGISHFLEHLFFKGTTTRTAREIIEPVEAKGGHLNAFTSREYTCLYVKTLDSHIATGIEILADIVKNSTFNDLEKERNVILEEIASIEDVPEDLIHDLLAEKMWPNHPLGRAVSGYEDTVSALTLDAIRSYYASWYKPRNMYFSIAGNFDEMAVMEQIEREFGPLSAEAPASYSQPLSFSSGIKSIDRDIAQDHFCLGHPGPTVAEPRRYVYDVLWSALGGGSTSRLFQRVREDEGLAYSIYTFHSAYFSGGMFGVYAAVAPENLDRTLEITFEEMRSLRDVPMKDEELDINREHLKGSMLMSLEGTFNRMSRMAKSMMYYNRLLTIDEVIEGVDAVAAKDVQTLCAEIFQQDTSALVVLGPTSDFHLKELPL